MSYERRKVRIGQVVSDKMDKTVVVVYEWSRPHPIYKKAVRRQTRFNAHDPDNQCRIGDTVRIVETRPISKTKRWKVAEIISSREIAELQPEEIQIDESVATAAATSALDQPAGPDPDSPDGDAVGADQEGVTGDEEAPKDDAKNDEG
jgi:small subunit ribosomal protein S17